MLTEEDLQGVPLVEKSDLVLEWRIDVLLENLENHLPPTPPELLLVTEHPLITGLPFQNSELP